MVRIRERFPDFDFTPNRYFITLIEERCQRSPEAKMDRFFGVTPNLKNVRQGDTTIKPTDPKRTFDCKRIVSSRRVFK